MFATFVLRALESLEGPKRSKLLVIITGRLRVQPTEVVAIVQSPRFSCLAAQALRFHPLPRLSRLNSPLPEEDPRFQITLRLLLDQESSPYARDHTG